jgi:hypothetical protein
VLQSQKEFCFVPGSLWPSCVGRGVDLDVLCAIGWVLNGIEAIDQQVDWTDQVTEARLIHSFQLKQHKHFREQQQQT